MNYDLGGGIRYDSQEYQEKVLRLDGGVETKNEVGYNLDGRKRGGQPGNQNAVGPHKKRGGRIPLTKENIRKELTGHPLRDGRNISGVSDHAVERMQGIVKEGEKGNQSPIYIETVLNVLDNADGKPSKTREGYQTFDYNGTRVVISDSDTTIATVTYRGKKRKGK